MWILKQLCWIVFSLDYKQSLNDSTKRLWRQRQIQAFITYNAIINIHVSSTTNNNDDDDGNED